MPIQLDSASSVEEFGRKVSNIRREWFPDYPLFPWCRGQERSEWPLVPKLYRGTGDLHTEYEIREEFCTRAPALSDYTKPSDDRVLSKWEWYFVMQHYGAPTRLLDWTEAPLVSLYFAVRSNRGNFPAAVWMVDAWWLNRTVIHKDEVIPPADSGTLPADRKRVAAWLPDRFKKGVRLPRLPCAVYPTHTMRRISAQRSCFTIHGSAHDGFDELRHGRKRARLVKIEIPAWEVKQVRNSLESYGVDETAIFPDLEALGRAVTLTWNSESKSEARDRPDDNVYTRLGRSKLHGIGIFAIRRIRSGTRLFKGDDDGIIWVDTTCTSGLSQEVKRLYADFAIFKGKRYGCPVSFNRLTPAWYINDSRTNPNVRCDKNYEFFALRDIKRGEELTVDYSQYNDPTPVPIK
ncbi:MAG: FRG domain-containing protein [Acidobacteriia bacterium]|nr:FRG domain-containing protein [Terriglobia bacterium]